MQRITRRDLKSICASFSDWITAAQQLDHDLTHLPLGDPPHFDGLDALLPTLLDPALPETLRTARPLLTDWIFNPTARTAARTAGNHLHNLHTRLHPATALADATSALAELTTHQHNQLHAALNALPDLHSLARTILNESAHLPITTGNPLTDAETHDLHTLADADITALASHAANLLRTPACTDHDCEAHHQAARTLTDLHTTATRHDIPAIADRIRKQLNDERHTLHALNSDVLAALELFEETQSKFENLRKKSDQGLAKLVRKSVRVHESRDTRLLPLTRDLDKLNTQLHELAGLQPLIPKLQSPTIWAQEFRDVVQKTLTARMRCRASGRCKEFHENSPTLIEKALEAVDFAASIASASEYFGPIDWSHLCDDQVGLPRHTSPGTNAYILSQSAKTRLHRAARNAKRAYDQIKAKADTVRTVADDVREAEINARLDKLPLETLREAADGRINIAALKSAGVQSISDLINRTYQFRARFKYYREDGEYPITIKRAIQAAFSLRSAIEKETPVRINVATRDKNSTHLLERLHAQLLLKAAEKNLEILKSADRIALLPGIDSTTHTGLLALTTNRPTVDKRFLSNLTTDFAELTDQLTPVENPWTDFLSRPAEYLNALTRLGYLTEDSAATHGGLPDGVVNQVRKQDLDTSGLKVTLRAYQEFGARFALARKKVIIGDEMGLGKTVEALAVLSHLRRHGKFNFIVVCPAAVIANWVRETTKHTNIQAFAFHGTADEQKSALDAWRRAGGVLVSTFDLLRKVATNLSTTSLDAIVIDEAHYIKNPTTQRSKTARQLIHAAPYAVLMTGTPLENNLTEFRTLISYADPDLASSLPLTLSEMFKDRIAPVYIRRNQVDVMSELPELIEIDEWLTPGRAEQRKYEAAVIKGNLMGMRQASMITPNSAKLNRLLELTQEATENNKRVIVFSYFKGALEQARAVLKSKCFGPITGSTKAADRQLIVDRFSKNDEAGVLLAQITAGGVGLNIQAASVVILCEPQLKPSLESQAIARAHRMGQTERVQVHRLIDENSVDSRILAILREKREVFEEFAATSSVVELAPESVDASDGAAARAIIEAERRRLHR